MIYYGDGRIRYDLNEDDVRLAMLFIQEITNGGELPFRERVALVKQFRDADPRKSLSTATAIVYCAEEQLRRVF